MIKSSALKVTQEGKNLLLSSTNFKAISKVLVFALPLFLKNPVNNSTLQAFLEHLLCTKNSWCSEENNT